MLSKEEMNEIARLYVQWRRVLFSMVGGARPLLVGAVVVGANRSLRFDSGVVVFRVHGVLALSVEWRPSWPSSHPYQGGIDRFFEKDFFEIEQDPVVNLKLCRMKLQL